MAAANLDELNAALQANFAKHERSLAQARGITDQAIARRHRLTARLFIASTRLSELRRIAGDLNIEVDETNVE